MFTLPARRSAGGQTLQRLARNVQAIDLPRRFRVRPCPEPATVKLGQPGLDEQFLFTEGNNALRSRP